MTNKSLNQLVKFNIKAMWRTICSTVFATLLLVFSAQSSYATHAAGAELTYRSLGGLMYEIEATFYRDCGGTPEPGNISISYRSVSCNYTRTALAIKVSTNNGTEITMPCATSNSSCNGGVSTGIRKWIYRTVVTLPMACNDWLFSYRICCRNCTVTTIQSPCSAGSELYIEAGLNNLDGPGNSSPVFSNSPIAFVCLGQNFNYNTGAIDYDGDSLSYELISPKTSATSEVTWIAPASAQSPLTSSTPFTINPITGDINFTPSSMQVSVMAIRINEFRNGIWIGSTLRDMQVYTQNCFNAIPSASGINGTSNFVANVCAGDSICFDIQTFDSDVLQNVSVSWVNPITGSSITETPGSRPSLKFCWVPAQTDVSSLPNTFTVLVRDDACPQNGTQTYSYTIYVSGLQISTTSTNPTCQGINNGSASVVGGPISGYTYEWNTTPPQNTETATGLSPGIYFVVVTDNNGCSSTDSIEIYAPVTPLSLTINSSGVITCQSGNIGNAEAIATNGTPPYSYLWSTGSTASQISGLGHGTYTVTVTDGNSCTYEDTISIPMVAGTLSTSFNATSMISCYGGTNGSIRVAVSGGTEPYSYVWSNGEVSEFVQNLPVGSYTVTVNDANGCSSTLSTTLSGPQNPISHSVSAIQHVGCFGGSDGFIQLAVSGGTAPYSYNWSNGATNFSNVSLAAGTYHVTVTDANGCILNISEEITQPHDSLVTSVLNMNNVSCAGESTGTISILTVGGSSPYTYLWNNGASTNNISGLGSGDYNVTVTDVNGCVDTLSVFISEPDVPITLIVTNVNHIQCDQPLSGSVNISAFGGTPPLSFLWSNGAVTQNLSNVSDGSYTVTVSDVNGCSFQSTSQVQNNGSAVIIQTTHIQNVLCYNMSNGSISLEPSGGAEPYSYLWSNGSTNRDIHNLAAGTYTVTVTDQLGCTSQADFSIEQPSAPLIPLITVTSHVNCFGSEQGGLSLQVNGGTAPYQFLWSNGSTFQNLTGINAGTYTVTVTDANGCNAIISELVHGPSHALVGSIVILDPIYCYGNSNASITVNANGGTPPLSYLWNTGETTATLSNLAAGSYSVTVSDAWGCTYTESVVLNQPQQQLAISGIVTPANCINNIEGSIELQLSGGSEPYSYLWSNGSIAPVLSTSIPGTYTVTITDANGCSARDSFNLSSQSQLNLNSDGPLTICVGDMVTLLVDSLPGAEYQWYFQGNILNGATGMSFTTPAAGYYHVEVSGLCGKFVSDTVLVEVKSIGNVTITNMQIICPPETANLIATGGVIYSWSPSTYITFTNVPDPIVSPLVTTEYSVEITNEYGCKTSLSTNVAVVCDSLLIPTGFSPNDDGVNDGYVVEGIENYPGNKLWVYNRWGKLVYKATDYNNSWDGVSNVSGIYMSKKLPTGTYYYILDLNDRSKPRAGYIILRR